MKSKRTMKFQVHRKTNSELAETVRLAMKNKAWNALAAILAGPISNYSILNLGEIDSKTSAGDTIAIPGKVLSLGELNKKIKICALSISQSAREKLKASKSEFVHLKEEIKSNTKMQGVKLIR